MNPIITSGRIVFALPFALFGISHFLNASAMAPSVPIPGGVFWVYFTGVALLAGSIGIVTRVLGKWAAFGLAALMLVFVVSVHIPHLRDPQMGQMAMISLLKDVALAGGALTWAGIFHAREQGETFGPSPRRPAAVH